MSDEKVKVIEKHYIEVEASGKKKFLHGLLSGVAYGIGLTLGTTIVIAIIGYFVSKVDFVPIFGTFLSKVITAAQSTKK